jgi:glycosyltransferase involved in cell wall biosynthesis
MKLLFVSNLFPDRTEPGRGLYNARIVQRLAERAEVRVVAPRPSWRWHFPPRAARPEDESAQPIFPRAWYVPRVGSHLNHLLMTEALRGPLASLRSTFAYDAILASWIYPDACAVARIAPSLGVPFVAVAQGSDAHQYLQVPARRRIIVEHLRGARAVVTRSAELSRLLAGAGVSRDKLRVIYNGVDRQVFHPGDRLAARAQLGWDADGEVVLFVGNLVPVKNPRLLVEAFGQLSRPRARLVIAGEGPLLEELRAAAGARVTFVGRKREPEVALLMRAANVLAVPSDNEGVPNVILEAQASGLPVVATRVGGIPEVVDRALLGVLVARDDATAMAAALRAVLSAPQPTGEIAAHAARYDWDRAIDAYFEALGS